MWDMSNSYLGTSTPFNMPVGQAPVENLNWAYGGSGYNPYGPNNSASQRMDLLAQTQQFNHSNSTYQQNPNFVPTMSPEVQALWDKRQTYNAMSDADKQLARTTGNGYFNNADAGNLMDLTVGNKSIDMQTQADLNRWTRDFNTQLAQNQMNIDNGNMPSNNKLYADLVLNNHAFVGNINDSSAVAPPTGNQMGWILHSQDNHGLAPIDRLDQWAQTRDFFSNAQGLGNAKALQTQSGTHNGAGMAGQGSGNFQGFSMVDTAAPVGGWGNFDSGHSSYVGNQWDGMGGKQTPGNFGWGTQEGYNAGYHAPKPFANNSLLGTGGNGITNTGATSIASLPNINGSWSSNQMGQLPQAGNTGFGGPTTHPTYGPGGPSIFADPGKTGNDYTLQGMPGYHPELGNNGLDSQRHNSVYGGSTQEGYKDPGLNSDWLRGIGTGVDYGASNPFQDNPFLISSADVGGSGVANSGNDAFSNYTDPSWQRPGYAQYPANTNNPSYRPANTMPWYTQINPFTAGQILATMGMRS